MTILDILVRFLGASTCPLVCLLVALSVVGLAYILVCGYAYLMRKYGKQVSAFLLSVALLWAGLADKPDTGGTNAPPSDVQRSLRVDSRNGGVTDARVVPVDGTLSSRMMSTLSNLSPNDGLVVEPFAVRPANVVENARWRARGAHVDGLTIQALGWRFRTPAGFLDSLLVYSYGEIQPDVETAYFPRPFPEADLSLLPEGKWGMIPHEGAESLFWYATSPSNSLILTWQNAAYDRDANCPTNLQIELFSNGTYVYRYDDRMEYHTVEYPFDLDGDGLENSVDPDPLVSGNDAHGTNVEWYDFVCSNVFSKTDQPNSLPIPLPNGESLCFKPGVNTNAYYFVDVVAERGPAPIYFNSSHPGRLGSPVVVALAGETNRVPLLIGATYSVTSDVPFTVSCPTNSFAEVAWGDEHNATVRWPLNFTFTEALSSTGRSYTVGVESYDPGGVFTWGHEHGGATLQSFSPSPNEGCTCSCASGNGNTVTFGCLSSCMCGGNCLAVGVYNFEQVAFAVKGGVCRCGFDDPPTPEQPTLGPLDKPALSISFSVPAVIFENAYVESPGVTQPHRSTRTRLTVTAWGGPSGATLDLSVQNLDKLSPVACGPMILPPQVLLAPFQLWTASFLCEGTDESAEEDDIVVTGVVTDQTTALTERSHAELTSQRLVLRALQEAPVEYTTYRHDYGIGERVAVYYYPTDVHPSIEVMDGEVADFDAISRISWGVADSDHTLKVTTKGVGYHPLIRVLKPTAVEGLDVGYEVRGEVPEDQAGGIFLTQRYRIHPLSVSFRGLAIEEVPCDEEITPDVYFLYLLRFEPYASSLYRSHSRAMGAGVWHAVEQGNMVGQEGTVDRTGVEGFFPRMTQNGMITTNTAFGWLGGGAMAWKVPFGWNVPQPRESVAEPVGRFAEDTRQTIRVSTIGTVSVHKLNHVAERTIEGACRTYDENNAGSIGH